MSVITKSNHQHTSSFASIYDKSRPVCPKEIITIATTYLNKKINTVVDLGCGTGLSTEIWLGHASRIIGIDQDPDMIAVAESKNNAIEYITSMANDTTLENQTTDVIVCSQSFHWMEPETTLAEANRILRANGIFMSIDYDWPPVIDWKIEKAFNDLMKQLVIIKNNLLFVTNTANSYDKKRHLRNIKNCGYFTYCREIVLHHNEQCDANRFIAMALSQSAIQTLLKKHYQEVNPIIENFENIIHSQFKDQTLHAKIGYRVRIGIKK